MNIVIDTSIIISVVTNESHKNNLIEVTRGYNLVAPASIHWEVGNAFSAMFKRKRITIEQSRQAITEYQKIPIRFLDIELNEAIQLSEQLGIYAYDAYVISCAQKLKCPLISLDKGLLEAAQMTKVSIIEV